MSSLNITKDFNRFSMSPYSHFYDTAYERNIVGWCSSKKFTTSTPVWMLKPRIITLFPTSNRDTTFKTLYSIKYVGIIEPCSSQFFWRNMLDFGQDVKDSRRVNSYRYWGLYILWTLWSFKHNWPILGMFSHYLSHITTYRLVMNHTIM